MSIHLLSEGVITFYIKKKKSLAVPCEKELMLISQIENGK